MKAVTLLEALEKQGWEIIRYCPYFTDEDGSNKDRFVEMLDPDGSTSKVLESSLHKPLSPP